MKRVMIFSGFLGSGKTTTMVNTARYLRNKGVKVAIITNDLGSNLVDTNYVSLENIPVAEIPDGCFCHDVPDFTDKVNKLYLEQEPDIIFAEPVGSCVDIVRNVYSDIDNNYKDMELAPFTSVIDPKRYEEIYMNKGNNLFKPQITYMYQKQLEEADILLLNKIDTLSNQELHDIEQSIKTNFPDKILVPISAREKTNFDLWISEFLNGQKTGMVDLDIDWSYVEQAENMMAWYNKHQLLESENPYDYNLFANELMSKLKKAFENNVEIAHLKIILNGDDEYCKAALVGSERDIVFSDRFKKKHKKVDMIINCRAQTVPDILNSIVDEALKEITNKNKLVTGRQETQVFDSFAHAPEPSVVV